MNRIKKPSEVTFLCSHCLTEQLADEIMYKGHKQCYCPNCNQVCCSDYCMFFFNGRWNGPFYDDDGTREIDEHTYEIYVTEYEATKRAYEQAHKQLDFLIKLQKQS